MPRQTHVLEVWGELACFTRPEMKVERYSYPIITPSAARAIFEAIYWKPAFRWQVSHIELLSVPRYIALRRNEVKDKGPSEKTIYQWMRGAKPPEPIWADADKAMLGVDTKGRTQRQTMALKDVRYRLSARIAPWRNGNGELRAMEEQFLRHARRGQCFYQPYLGCREFPAFFRLVEPDDERSKPIPVDIDIGWMIYDVFDLSRPGKPTDDPAISVFRASIRQGVLEVPDYHSSEVRKVPRENPDAPPSA